MPYFCVFSAAGDRRRLQPDCSDDGLPVRLAPRRFRLQGGEGGGQGSPGDPWNRRWTGNHQDRPPGRPISWPQAQRTTIRHTTKHHEGKVNPTHCQKKKSEGSAFQGFHSVISNSRIHSFSLPPAQRHGHGAEFQLRTFSKIFKTFSFCTLFFAGKWWNWAIIMIGN